MQQWVDGTWTNHGLILVSDNENQNNAKIFVPVDFQNQGLIPVLNVEYTLP